MYPASLAISNKKGEGARSSTEESAVDEVGHQTDALRNVM